MQAHTLKNSWPFRTLDKQSSAPPSLLRSTIMARQPLVVGIDIGGTNTAFGCVDRAGSCLAELSIPTNASEPAENLVRRIDAAMKKIYPPLQATHELKGVGIGAPSANYYKGTVEHPPNLNWPGITDLAGMVRAVSGLPTAVTNDANAAALGELLFGAGKGMRDFIVITLGTGLGSGLIVNGSLVYGHDGFAGELGHTMVDPNGRECGCGKRGCLETYVSAPGLCKTICELFALRRAESPLRSVPPSEMTSKMIAEAAAKGDPIAREAYRVTGEILGRKLADSVAHTSPEAIILFGGMAGAGELIFAPTKRAMEEALLPLFRGKVKIIPSGLTSGNAAVLGSAALIWNELEK
jgi:glucokinase